MNLTFIFETGAFARLGTILGKRGRRPDAGRLAALDQVPVAPSCPQMRANRAEAADSPVGALARLAPQLTIIAPVNP